MATSTTSSPATMLRGGEWLLRADDPRAIFTPERIDNEHRLIAQTARAFVENEVLPQMSLLEQKDWPLARRLLARCGDLGLLAVDVAEEYGGLALDKVTSMIVSEQMSSGTSFGATFGAQANLTILPLTLFGTDAQKRKYLPGLLSGTCVGAYCLSESGSGSDALSAKTRAVKQRDGSFVLNGEKMWITNGGFADLFIVFAKVIDESGEHFTAFIVERAFTGVSSGKEEHKMGLHGSSTTPVILQDVAVPAGNLLGEIGKGHKVAFNVLNFGRFKLGASCSGGAHVAIAEAAKYAAQRKQFGQPIGAFGAIKHKIGEMTSRAYAVESALYRTAGMIDARIEGAAPDVTRETAALETFEQYAIEASIAKVAGSEMLDFVLDENIQIHGGNGFVADYPAERHYRDARVNRIFEGTNEINRLLIPGMLARRALKGELPIIAAATALQDELMGPPVPPVMDDSVLADERRAVEAFRKTALMILGLALQTYGAKLADEQEVLMLAADILIDLYSADSAVLRAAAATDSRAPLHVDAARVFVNDAAMRIETSARQALATMMEGDALRTTLAALRRVLKVLPINTTVIRRRLADATVAHGGYIFLRSDRRRSPLPRTARTARWLTTLLVIAAVAACGHKPPEDQDYAAKVARGRAQKDAAFRKDAEPVPASRKAALLPLSYFSIDPRYDVAAVLKPPAAGLPDGAGTPAGRAAAPGVVVMPTSTGGQREMRRVGTLEFLLKGQPLKLTAFVEVGAPNLDRLFVPFSDLTTGTETYPAGRYLDLDRNGSGIYDLDFNRAYQPYCYYNPNYDCPYPPSENRLKIPIRAGERLKKEEVKG